LGETGVNGPNLVVVVVEGSFGIGARLGGLFDLPIHIQRGPGTNVMIFVNTFEKSFFGKKWQKMPKIVIMGFQRLGSTEMHDTCAED
jgi:hypothetical protein